MHVLMREPLLGSPCNGYLGHPFLRREHRRRHEEQGNGIALRGVEHNLAPTSWGRLCAGCRFVVPQNSSDEFYYLFHIL